MSHTNHTALKAIVAMGVLTFLILLASSVGLKQVLQPNEDERILQRRSESPFDGQRALERTKTLLSFGSRAVGGAGHEAAEHFIRDAAATSGLRMREIASTVTVDGVELKITHLVGERPGRKPGAVLLMVHYDAWPGRETYVGANDGAAASAWLLECAATANRDFFGRELWFAWLDGAGRGGESAARAAQDLVSALQADPKAAKIEAAIYVDAIGDAYLGIAHDPAAPAWLSGIVDETAAHLRLTPHFGEAVRTSDSISSVLNGRGIPTLALIDASYGGSLVEHAKYWHTDADTLERLAPESLKAVGDLIYHALPAVDGRLDAMGMGTK